MYVFRSVIISMISLNCLTSTVEAQRGEGRHNRQSRTQFLEFGHIHGGDPRNTNTEGIFQTGVDTAHGTILDPAGIRGGNIESMKDLSAVNHVIDSQIPNRNGEIFKKRKNRRMNAGRKRGRQERKWRNRMNRKKNKMRKRLRTQTIKSLDSEPVDVQANLENTADKPVKWKNRRKRILERMRQRQVRLEKRRRKDEIRRARQQRRKEERQRKKGLKPGQNIISDSLKINEMVKDDDSIPLEPPVKLDKSADHQKLTENSTKTIANMASIDQTTSNKADTRHINGYFPGTNGNHNKQTFTENMDDMRQIVPGFQINDVPIIDLAGVIEPRMQMWATGKESGFQTLSPSSFDQSNSVETVPDVPFKMMNTRDGAWRNSNPSSGVLLGQSAIGNDIPMQTVNANTGIPLGPIETSNDFPFGHVDLNSSVHGFPFKSPDSGTRNQFDNIQSLIHNPFEPVNSVTGNPSDPTNFRSGMSLDPTNSESDISFEPITTGSGIPFDLVHSRTDLQLEVANAGTVIPSDSTNSGTGIPIEPMNSRSGISLDPTISTTNISPEAINSGIGSSFEPIDSRIGIPFDPINNGSGIQFEPAQFGTGIPLDSTNSGTDTSFETVNFRTGVLLDPNSSATDILSSVSTNSETGIPIEPMNSRSRILFDPAISSSETININSGSGSSFESMDSRLGIPFDPMNNGTGIQFVPTKSGTAISLDPTSAGSNTSSEPVNVGTSVSLEPINATTNIQSKPITSETGIPFEPLDFITGIPFENTHSGTVNQVPLKHVNSETGIPFEPTNFRRGISLGPTNSETGISFESVIPGTGIPLDPIHTFDTANAGTAIPSDSTKVGTDIQMDTKKSRNDGPGVSIEFGNSDTGTLVNSAKFGTGNTSDLANTKNGNSFQSMNSGTESMNLETDNILVFNSTDPGTGMPIQPLASGNEITSQALLNRATNISGNISSTALGLRPGSTNNEATSSIKTSLVDTVLGESVNKTEVGTGVIDSPDGPMLHNAGEPMNASITDSQNNTGDIGFDPSFGDNGKAVVFQSIDLREFLSTGNVKTFDSNNQPPVKTPEPTEGIQMVNGGVMPGIQTVSGDIMQVAGQTSATLESNKPVSSSSETKLPASSLLGVVFEISRLLGQGKG